MKITVLGSGGGEGFPATFCGCDHCVAARLAGGKSIRTLSQTLINDDLLIDFPSDTSLHALRHGLNIGDVPNLLITHAHHDHFAPQLLFSRGGVYAHNLKHGTLNIYGSSFVKEVWESVCSTYSINKTVYDNISLNEILPYETKRVGRYDVTALPAKHGGDKLKALNYIISDGEKTLIYFHDTGFPELSVLDFIKGQEKFRRVACVMMDATMGYFDTPDTKGHMSFDQDKRLKELLIKLDIATESTVFVANHITHNGAETHDKIEEIFSGSGIKTSYDSMVIEV